MKLTRFEKAVRKYELASARYNKACNTKKVLSKKVLSGLRRKSRTAFEEMVAFYD